MSPFLKLSRLLDDLSLDGRFFQSSGAEALKDLAVKVFSLVLGLSSKFPLFEHNPSLAGLCGDMSSCRYCGPSPCSDLYVSTKILYAIHCLIGSQCRLFWQSEALSYLDFLSTNHAHMF